jgi:hypothetical protein
MPIEHEHIRRGLQCGYHIQHRRAFPETQQARYIRECKTASGSSILQEAQFRIAKDHRYGVGPSISIADINTGDGAQCTSSGMVHDEPCQLVLQHYRFTWYQVPSMWKHVHSNYVHTGPRFERIMSSRGAHSGKGSATRSLRCQEVLHDAADPRNNASSTWIVQPPWGVIKRMIIRIPEKCCVRNHSGPISLLPEGPVI